MSSLKYILLPQREKFQAVMPFSPGEDRLVALDFTEMNPSLTDAVINDLDAFCQYVDNCLLSAGARYGIGGYAEWRGIYRRSEVFDGEEPRRLHLGVDIWGKAGTPLMAPLDGRVHSLGNHNRMGDYGAVMILEHQLSGSSFYTLYGHLSLRSLLQSKPGDGVAAGQVFAWLGQPEENGYWPPYLHFQIIRDLEGNSGDFPGVCSASKREQYLANCPDPDWILNWNRYCS